MSIEAACFDLDGCLVDSRHAISTAINHALEALGLTVRPPQDLHAFIGPPLLASFEQLILEDNGDVELASEAVRLYRSVYPELAMTQTPVWDGVHEMLTTIGEQMPMAVVTSKPRAYAQPIVEAVGLLPYFVEVFGPELHALHEPKATKLREAIESLDLAMRPGSVAMIGDTIFDIEAGRACGTLTVGVLWGIGAEAGLRTAGADHLASSPDDVRQVLLA